jgi:hypothetical protein
MDLVVADFYLVLGRLGLLRKEDLTLPQRMAVDAIYRNIMPIHKSVMKEEARDKRNNTTRPVLSTEEELVPALGTLGKALLDVMAIEDSVAYAKRAQVNTNPSAMYKIISGGADVGSRRLPRVLAPGGTPRRSAPPRPKRVYYKPGNVFHCRRSCPALVRSLHGGAAKSCAARDVRKVTAAPHMCSLCQAARGE